MNTLRSAGWKRTPGAGTWPTWLRVRSGMVLTQVRLPKAPRDFFTLGQLSVQTLLQNVTVCLSHAAPLLKKKNDYKARTHRYCRSFCVKPHWMSHCLDEDKKLSDPYPYEDTPLVDFMFFTFTCMPGELPQATHLCCCVCGIFQALIDSLVCWFSISL